MSDKSNKFKDEISSFVKRNFPQIDIHGGESSIVEANEETGYVHINLSGACSGCGISPMTVEQIKRRMFQNMDDVKEIKVTTGVDSLGDTPQPVSFDDEGDDDDTSHIQAPF